MDTASTLQASRFSNIPSKPANVSSNETGFSHGAYSSNQGLAGRCAQRHPRRGVSISIDKAGEQNCTRPVWKPNTNPSQVMNCIACMEDLGSMGMGCQHTWPLLNTWWQSHNTVYPPLIPQQILLRMQHQESSMDTASILKAGRCSNMHSKPANVSGNETGFSHGAYSSNQGPVGGYVYRYLCRSNMSRLDWVGGRPRNGHFILGARKPSQIMSQGLQLHRDQMKSERPLNLSLVTKASSEEVRNFSI